MLNLGSINDPIDLDSQQTNEQQQQQKRLEYESNRKKLYQAHMGSQFDVILAVIKTQLPGSQEDKNKIIASRIKKFFSSQIKKMNPETDFFRKRRESDCSNSKFAIIPNQLILYGVDFLSTKQIRVKFEGLSPQVTWIDDSHCKVSFPSQRQAEAGIQNNLLDCPQNKVKQNEREEMQLPSGWYELRPYNYMTYTRKLQCRYSNTLDNDVQIKRSNEYYMMQEAKRQFDNSLKSEFTQDKYLRTMLKYNFIDDQSYRRMTHTNRGDSRGQWNTNRQQRGAQNRQNRRDNNRFVGRFNRDRGGENQQIGRGGRNNFQQQRNNNYRNNRNERSISNRSQSRSRNKNNRNNIDKKSDYDNLSILSQPKSHKSHKSQKLNMSLSYAEHQQSPINKNNKQQDDDNKSSLSFLLSRSEISNGRANIVMNQFKDMRIDDISVASSSRKSKANFEPPKINNTSFSSNNSKTNKVPAKVEEHDLSIDLTPRDNKPMRKNKDSSLSIIQIPE